mgnify:CR=1 FL=1
MNNSYRERMTRLLDARAVTRKGSAEYQALTAAINRLRASQ